METKTVSPEILTIRQQRLTDCEADLDRLRREVHDAQKARAQIVGSIAAAYGESDKEHAEKERQRILRSNALQAIEALRFCGTFADAKAGQRLWEAVTEVRDAIVSEES